MVTTSYPESLAALQWAWCLLGTLSKDMSYHIMKYKSLQETWAVTMHHLDPLVSNRILQHFIQKCQTTVRSESAKLSQATVDGNSQSFKDSWFWGLADAIILNVEGRLNSEGGSDKRLAATTLVVCCITAACRPWSGRNFLVQQRYKKHSIACGCLRTSRTRPLRESIGLRNLSVKPKVLRPHDILHLVGDSEDSKHVLTCIQKQACISFIDRKVQTFVSLNLNVKPRLCNWKSRFTLRSLHNLFHKICKTCTTWNEYWLPPL